MIEYYFDYKGKWIAFRQGKYLYNSSARWIGWFPWENGIAVDTDGKYFATVYEDRLLVDLLQKKVKYPGYPGFPGIVTPPTHPGFRGYCGYIPNTEDISERRLEAL